MRKEKTNLKKKKSYISYFMIPAVFFGIVFLKNKAGIINAYWYQIIQLASINAIVAMSLNLINGMDGQFSLGQAGFMSVGAYTAAMMTKMVFAEYEELLFYIWTVSRFPDFGGGSGGSHRFSDWNSLCG